jgi:hypothetical protein
VVLTRDLHPRGQERATEDMMKLRDERIKKLTEVIQVRT